MPQAKITLGIKQPVFIKPSPLKTVIHIGGQDKIIPVLQQYAQGFINIAWYGLVAIDVNLPAPESPELFQCWKRIKTCCVKVGKAIFVNEVAEIVFKTRACIGHPRGCGKTCARANQNSVSTFQFFFNFFYCRPVSFCRWRNLCLYIHQKLPLNRNYCLSDIPA